jgi:16S rRNA (cytosine967-C5)-methyltransferase
MNEDVNEKQGGEKSKRPWKPNRTRTVKSKKSFDRKKMEHLVSEDRPAYKGELDPRQKDPDRKPRSISFSEQKVMDKAAKLAEKEGGGDGRNRLATHTDFRELFETCKASPGRLAALYATQQVRKRKAYAQEIIEASIDTSKLSAEDRAFATLLTLGVVSTQGALDNVINRAIRDPRDIQPDVRDAIRISAYEIIFLKKAPHAAVDQGVELVRAVAPSASGLANAVLHRILEGSDKFPYGDPTKDIDALALLYAFPTWLTKTLVADLGAQAAVQLMKASNGQAPLFISVNALQATDDEIVALFSEVGCELEPASSGGVEVAGCYRVPNTRALADGRIARLFSQGKILVSDASAQAVAQSVLEGGLPENMLEIGSGRGTKTMLLQNFAYRMYGEQLALTCMDSHGFKTDLLRERAQAYGVEIEEFVTGNATRLDSVIGDRAFSTVFIDAPCSGLGTLRRHHEIRWRLQPEQIDELAEVGLALLKSAASHVSVGGTLVYSTCTVTYAENNGVIKRFLESDEGKNFKLIPIYGKACFAPQLSDDSPDAHFATKFMRIS